MFTFGENILDLVRFPEISCGFDPVIGGCVLHRSGVPRNNVKVRSKTAQITQLIKKLNSLVQLAINNMIMHEHENMPPRLIRSHEEVLKNHCSFRKLFRKASSRSLVFRPKRLCSSNYTRRPFQSSVESVKSV